MASDVRAALAGTGVSVSALGIYGNPLQDSATDQLTRQAWAELIDHVAVFDCDIVSGFTGRIPGKPIGHSFPRFCAVFGPLTERAAALGVRLAFENCHMDGTWHAGDWNIAHGPRAWERIFNALPAENLGLKWEPCHQVLALVDPLPQLHTWVSKIFHVHGKDATINWSVIRSHGVDGPEPYGEQRFLGLATTDWRVIFDELRRGGCHGAINIEGWHDPVLRNELEMTGQVAASRYLQQCHGEAVPNPISARTPSPPAAVSQARSARRGRDSRA